MKRLMKYIIYRLGFSVIVLLGLSLLIFLIIFIMPGDPARTALGGRAPEWVIQELREELRLDEPVYVQYYHWLKGAVRFDFGDSLITKRPVVTDIKEYLPASLELALFAAFIALVLGTFLGVVSGWNANSLIDNTVRIISYTGVVTPSFVWAYFLILFFGLYWGVLPVTGRLSPLFSYTNQITGLLTLDALLTGNIKLFLNGLKHLIMPSLALMMMAMAGQARLTRTSISSTSKKDFICSVRSYGIPEKVVMYKYLLKPSLVPPLSVFGPSVAAIIANAFLIETIFNWPGLSRYGMNAIMQKDINAISAVVLVYGTLYIIANIVIDIVVGYLDPRVISSKS